MWDKTAWDVCYDREGAPGRDGETGKVQMAVVLMSNAEPRNAQLRPLLHPFTRHAACSAREKAKKKEMHNSATLAFPDGPLAPARP